MSSVGELTTNVTCDVSSLTSGMMEARAQLAQTTSAVQSQEQVWDQLTASVGRYAEAVASLSSVSIPAITLPELPEQAAPSITPDVSGLAAAMSEARSELDKTTVTIQTQDQSWRSLADGVLDFATAAAAASNLDTSGDIAAGIAEARKQIDETNPIIQNHKEVWDQLTTTAKEFGETEKATNGVPAVATASVEELTRAMTRSGGELQKTITLVQKQETSWSSLGQTVLGATGHIVGPVLGLIAAQRAQAAAAMNAAAANSIAASTSTIVGVSSAAATPPTLTFAAAMAFLTAPVTLITVGLTAVAAAIYYFVSSSEDAAESTEAVAKSADKSAHKLTAMEHATKALSDAQKEFRKTTAQTSESLSAMEISAQSLKGGIFPEDTAEQIHKVAKEAANVQNSWGNLKATLSQPFIDASVALGRYLADMLGIKSAAESAADGLKLLNDGIQLVEKNSKVAINELQAMARSHGTGESIEASRAYIAEGEAITELAARTGKAIARLEEQRKGYKLFAQQMAEATESAAHNAEVQRINSITSIEGLDNELRALQARSAAEITAEGNYVQALKARGATKSNIEAQEAENADNAKQRAELLNAIESQRKGIETGQIKPADTAADAAIKSATQSLLALTAGQDVAAQAALRAAGGTDAEVESLRNLQSQINGINAAREAEKVAQDARNQMLAEAQQIEKASGDQITRLKDKIDVLNGSATEAEIAMRELARRGFGNEAVGQITALNAEVERLSKAKQGADKITGLKDQIDILSGAATEAEVAMRELGREGFSDEQIAEIGQLMKELDRLKKANQKPPKADSKAAFAGSREAAEIMLRGVGGGNRMESLASAQLAEQKKIADIVSALAEQKKIADIAAAVSAKPAVTPPHQLQIQPLPEQPGLPVVQPPPAAVAPLAVPPLAGFQNVPEFIPPPPLSAPSPPSVSIALPPPAATSLARMPVPKMPAPPSIKLPDLPSATSPVIAQPRRLVDLTDNVRPQRAELPRSRPQEMPRAADGISSRAGNAIRDESGKELVRASKDLLAELKRNTAATSAIKVPEFKVAKV